MDSVLINIISLQEHCKERVIGMVEEMKQVRSIKWRFEEGIYGKYIRSVPTIEEKIEKLTYSYRNFSDTRFYDRRRRIGSECSTLGELGAGWSHLNLYKKLLHDDRYNFYLILEDDTIILDIEYLEQLLSNLPPEFDIAHLATSIWNGFVKNQKVNDLFYTPVADYFNCAAAYIVSKSGAQKLLNFANDSIFCPPDDLLSNAFLFTNNFKVIIPERPVFGMGANNEISVVSRM